MTRLFVEVPDNCREERQYIVETVLGEFFGLTAELQFRDRSGVLLHDGTGRHVLIADTFFETAAGEWLGSKTLPTEPLRNWRPSDHGLIGEGALTESLPVIYGGDPESEKFFQRTDRSCELGLDVFGASFFMMSRYEEVARTVQDKLDRFPAAGSIAWREGFIDRPVVNEYLDILWACIESIWPGLERSEREFRVLPSHDVDSPYLYPFMGPRLILRRMAADVLKRHSVSSAVKSARHWLVSRRQPLRNDPHDTFDWILEWSNSLDLQSTFFFICDHTAGEIDGIYDIENPLIHDLMRKIHSQGHGIGLHPSHNTFLDPAQTTHEFRILRKVCESLGVEQETWGSRQHNLRWRTPTTAIGLDAAGLDYDSTMGFADRAGFRTGVCYEHRLYDVAHRRPLELRERPLVVMECTVMDERYMGLGTGSRAYELMSSLKEKCRRHRGDFTLLWHNSRLTTDEARELYSQVLSA